MFPLHDRTRRRICRWAFLIGGLIPTATVLAWAASINSASHLAAVRERLEAELGVEVRLASVSYPRPETTLLEGLELADRETGETLLRMRLLEISSDEQSVTIVASQPVVEMAAVDRLWPLVDRQLHRRSDGKQRALHLAASELTVRWSGGSQTLVGCNAQLEAGDAANTLIAVCRTAENQTSEPIRLRLERSSRCGQFVTSAELDTGPTPLPCSLLAAMLQCENRLGQRSTLHGTIQAAQSPDGWQGEFAGELKNVDLHSVVSNQFPHKLGGTGDLKIKQAFVVAGRLESAEGEIEAGPGMISQSLISAAVESLGMQRGVAANTGGSVAEYEKLLAGFSLGSKGLSIRGRYGDARSGVVMVSKEGEMLHESARSTLPIVALVKALVPDSQVQVPATRQSDWLLHVLPVPDVLPHDPNAVPQARIRGPEPR